MATLMDPLTSISSHPVKALLITQKKSGESKSGRLLKMAVCMDWERKEAKGNSSKHKGDLPLTQSTTPQLNHPPPSGAMILPF